MSQYTVSAQADILLFTRVRLSQVASLIAANFATNTRNIACDQPGNVVIEDLHTYNNVQFKGVCFSDYLQRQALM